MSEPPPLRNPYVGPRAYRLGETLYGRDEELRELFYLLSAERIVLLHAPSGAGKSSLIQAALIPRLVEAGFSVLPVARVGADPGAAPAGANRYLLSALLDLDEPLPAGQQTPLEVLATRTLDDYLRGRPGAADADGSEVLILDQFEEILTVAPGDQAGKRAFFAQLGQALRDRRRWALIAMRSDSVADLEPYLLPVPTRLSHTFPLPLLGPESARRAMQGPARAAGVDFTDEAATRLADDLRTMTVQRPDGGSERALGQAIEPVQLQVVCLRLWERLFETGGQGDRGTGGQGDRGTGGSVSSSPPPLVPLSPSERSERVPLSASAASGPVPLSPSERSERVPLSASAASGPVPLSPSERSERGPVSASAASHAITVADVAEAGDVDTALRDYYAERVRAAAEAAGVTERAAREWCERALITPGGLRGQALQEPGATQGLANAAIRYLIDSHLVRAEQRRGATWFELAHDRLVAPVQEANAAWREANLSTLQRQAALWAREGRPQGLLLQGPALAEAERWARQNDPILTQDERDFLAECRRARSVARRLRGLTAGALAGLLLAVILAVVALLQTQAATNARNEAVAEAERARTAEANAQTAADLARTAEAKAEAEKGRADQQLRLAEANKLAAQSGQLLGSATQRATLLALESLRVARPDDPHVAAAEESLRAALAIPGSQPLRGHEGSISAAAFSPDGRWLVTAGDDRTARLWPLADLAAEPTILRGHDGWVLAAAFSPDGRWLVTAGDDATARLWPLADLAAAPTILRGHEGYIINAAVFSPDGRWLVTAGADATARLWQMDLAVLKGLACARLARNLTWEEWLRYIGPEQAYRQTCPNLPAHPSTAQPIVADAATLLEAGNINRAIERYNEARAIDQQLDPLSDWLQAQAETLLQSGASERATTIYESLLAIDPSLANLATWLVAQAAVVFDRGDADRGMAIFNELLRRSPDLSEVSDANTLNSLCWDGALAGQAAAVLPACERAVSLAPDNGAIIDSRGLARALSGDMQGAIEDFRAFVAWAPGNGQADFVAERERWIAELEAGRNPFDAATLERLRDE